MITLRKSADRGSADHGWLKSRHTFSFASYFDPRQVKFRSLRVINEDWIQGGEGFGTHPHENMEIITYIIEGALEHRDSMGNGTVIRRGEIQRMSAGKGLAHSEFNPTDRETHLLQIWIYPERADLEPGYEQRDFSRHHNPDGLTLLASQTGDRHSVVVHQDVKLYGGLLAQGSTLTYALPRDRHAWIQMVLGTLSVNGVPLEAGDGAAIEDERSLALVAASPCEFLLFDLA